MENTTKTDDLGYPHDLGNLQMRDSSTSHAQSIQPRLTCGWADGHSTLQHLGLRATRDLQPLAGNLEPD